MIIRYTDSLAGISPDQLHGFFVGWARPLTPQLHLNTLKGSDLVELAIDSESGHVVGFVCALCDGIHSAFVPLLEVLPGYQHRGIGTELVTRLFARLEHIPAIDLVCDTGLESFYERFDMRAGVAMMIRH